MTRPALALAAPEPTADASPSLGPSLDSLDYSGGQPLPAPLVRSAESLLGTSLPGAEIHLGAAADEAAAEAGARAFTVGSHIFFRSGRYAPDTQAGRALLLHELAHVAQ
ncbi:DUF4157 domain-containing protein [Haliangium ochraceum]|uniref:eCIS core domain-containing protein n=1 Tax=Haliangium ochraceum (strain DSM 14365 / JCM 11303 / SMP-2) TaxID=502025 RepID=D0LPG9_HALO1|nr:DUF4157 domain-containing protein [Haliangium ochraceum]ACY13534.1 conserved hypothetical protein [Haliangium ochraceum DSM 14365]